MNDLFIYFQDRRSCYFRSFSFAVVFLFFLVPVLPTQGGTKVTGAIIRNIDDADEPTRSLVVPYGFYTEGMGIVAGLAGTSAGVPQEQNSLFVTGLVSDRGARAGYLFFNDYQTPFNERLFVDASIGLGDFPRLRGYFDPGAPSAPPAGSNESSENNFFEVNGYTDWIELDFRYVLATGSASKKPTNIYTLNKGLLAGGASGGEIWNPFVSGRTYIGARLFYHDRFYDTGGGVRLTTSGVDLAFDYDNTDFPINPATGSRLRISVKHDPGASGTSWTNTEARFSKYFSLPTGEKTNQRVIALGFWTADTLSNNQAPPNFGITLGGLYRMRAYPIERFYDRSAIYYSVEYRMIPKSDLLDDIKYLEFLNLKWWEIVAFYEQGRVAPDWDLAMLHSNMKSDAGVGLRVMTGQNIGRMDVAYSEEGWSLWFMVGHPF